MADNHEHCWHMMSTYTNGLGSEGHQSSRCCQCGAGMKQRWTATQDPDHGQYVTVWRRTYAEPEIILRG